MGILNLFFGTLLLFVSHTYAQKRIILRGSIGLQQYYSTTKFQDIPNMKLKNNIYDEHFFPSFMLQLKTKKKFDFNLGFEIRNGGYNYTASYSSPSCLQQFIKIQSISFEYNAFHFGFIKQINTFQPNSNFNTKIYFSSGITLLKSRNLNVFDNSTGAILCGDTINFYPKFNRNEKFGLGIPFRLDIDLFVRKKAVLTINFSIIKGLKNMLYYDNTISINNQTYQNQFKNKGNGIAIGIGYPFNARQK